MASSGLNATIVLVVRTPTLSFRRSPPATHLNRRTKNQFNCRLKSDMATGKSKGDVKVFDSNENLSLSLANYISDLSEKVTAQKSTFTVVFSGGSLFKSLRLQFLIISLLLFVSLIHALICFFF